MRQANFMKAYKVMIEEDGGFTIPPELLERLQLKDGDAVTLEGNENEFIIRKDMENPSRVDPE